MAVTAFDALSRLRRPPVRIPVRPERLRIAYADATADSSTILRQQAAVAAIASRSRGAASRLVGISRVEDFQALIVAPGIRIRRTRDLRDRRIGVPGAQLQSGAPRVHALRAATAVLEAEGLFFRSVEWVDLPPAEAVAVTLPSAYSAEIAALHSGAVDVVYVRGPAGLEAARAAGARMLVDLGAPRDAWLRARTALLNVVAVNAALLEDHPEVIAGELLERWPSLPVRLNLDDTSIAALELLKQFMLRWSFIHEDFELGAWVDTVSRSQA